MKGFIKRGAVIVIAGMLLTGCGDTLNTMTEAEESIIINYSAGMIGKFNTHQMDGIVGLKPQENEVEEQEQKELSKEPEAEDTTANGNESSNDKNSNEDKSPSSQEQQSQEYTITEALAIPGLEFKYDGYETTNNFRSSDIFSMAAPEGNTYLVLNITISNTGSQDVECDLLSKEPVFLLKLNGGSSIKNKITFLPDDLTTYKETIRAGSKAQTFLLFEIPSDEAADITSIEIDLNINEKSSSLKI